MAHLDATGRCVTGEVVAVDLDHKEVKPGNKRRSRVPLIELSLTAPTRLLAGESVRWVEEKKVKAVLRHVDGDAATFAVTAQATTLDDVGLFRRRRNNVRRRRPVGGPGPVGARRGAVDSTVSPRPISPATRSDDPGAGAADDSPDMTLEELADVAVVGEVGPDDEPGVVL